MEEIISMIPGIIITFLIFFFSNYFLKKDKQKHLYKNRIDSNPKYSSYLNTKAKLGKIISIMMIIIIVLKIVWILFLKQ
ncbi:hypothetical protein [Flavobacterium sp. CLA17]|uniref:hypothetical protein n=1 Tax=Flavobacterium sp. CLA17 TaxID=2724135 RepID=UPI001492CFB3|nr:hypothetical protein [Flavobacterium sp. CLA17]QSB26178.1 hypothetical protein HAV12_017575 [Flavobacterium sp. CLA17]